MTLQTLNSTTIIPRPTGRVFASTKSSFPTRKRSNKRTRRNIEEENYLAMCLVKLARGSTEIIKRPTSLSVKYHTSLEEEKIVLTKTTEVKKDEEEKIVLTKTTEVKKDQSVEEEEKSILTITMDVKQDQEPKAHICNVCNKSFSSHQALGGHKASHRSKPRTVIANVKSSNGGKVHECGVCQKTFGSGQALGGHMRKHFDGIIGSGVFAKNRSSYGCGEAVKSLSNEGGATISTGRRVVHDFDLNLSLTEDDIYCDESESAFM